MHFQPEIPYLYVTGAKLLSGCEVGSASDASVIKYLGCNSVQRLNYTSFQISVQQAHGWWATNHIRKINTPIQVPLLFLWTGSPTWPKPPANIWLAGFRSTLLPVFYRNCTPPDTSKNKDANQWTENWHRISSQRKPKTLRLGSVGEWSWLCPCSSSTVIWHMQRFALLQALRHWSKQAAPARPENNNRNKGTNDFVLTPAWCLPPAHHGLPAYPLSPHCLSPFLFRTFLHPRRLLFLSLSHPLDVSNLTNPLVEIISRCENPF